MRVRSPDARFADTPKRRWERSTPSSPPASAPPATPTRIGSNDDANAANTAVMVAGEGLGPVGGRLMAMDASDLSTKGSVTLRDDLAGMPFRAHLRYDPTARSGTSPTRWPSSGI
jgi:carotenoid cleavage dioxygenase-like enzyme